MELDYEKDMYIDDQNLELEVLNQATLAMKYGRHLADCRVIASRCEENIKLTRSELMNKANKDPKRYLPEGNTKDKNLEAFYRTSKRHIRAKEESIDADFELELAQIAYNEISRTRKFALESMIKLFGLNYFAGPSVPHDLTMLRDREKTRKNSNAKMRIGKKKRTRKN